MNRAIWRSGISCAAIGLCTYVLATQVTSRSASAQSPARPGETGALDRALQLTMATGRPVLVGVTSNALPSSRQLWKGLLASNMARELARTTQIVEVVAETEPAQVERLGVKAPTFLFVRRGEGGLDLASRISNPTDPYAVADWLGGLVPRGPVADGPKLAVGNPAETSKDRGLVRAGFHNDEAPAPSSQGYGPAPAPLPQMQMQMQAQAPQYMTPTFAAQPTQPGIVVPTQSPAVYVQQQPPTIVVGSPTTANVVYATNGIPNMGTPMLGMPSQPSGPTLGMPNQPQPVMGTPMMGTPVMGTPVMGMPTLGAGVQTFQTPTFGAGGGNNTPVVGLMLQRPSLLRRLLGAFGRELSNLGNPTVRMTTAPEIAQIPLSAATLGALAPASPAVVAQPAPVIVQGPAPGQPSPQSEPPRKHSFFHHD